MFACEGIEGHRVYIKIRIVGSAILASSLRVRANAVFPREYIVRERSAEKKDNIRGRERNQLKKMK